MLGLFSSELRLKRRKQDILTKADASLQERKNGFRVRALKECMAEYTDMVFAISETSPEFAGFSQTEGVYVFGFFLDHCLPGLFDLEQAVDKKDFEATAINFEKEVRNYSVSKLDVPVDLRILGIRAAAGVLVANFGSSGFGLYDSRFFATTIRLFKNERLFAESSVFKPRHEGYFQSAVFENVVMDLRSHIVSKFSIEIEFWNYADYNNMKIVFVYADPPRRNTSQHIGHLAEVCAAFMPFLSAVEREFLHRSHEFTEVGPAGDSLGDDHEIPF